MLLNLVRLFSTFFKIGLFSIGGGYAILPMIKEQVVLAKHWLTGQEFTDIITISQMTPGPIAVNTSSFVGIRVAGSRGSCGDCGMCDLRIYHLHPSIPVFPEKK